MIGCAMDDEHRTLARMSLIKLIGLADRARSMWSLGDRPRNAIKNSEICHSEKIYNAGGITGSIEILPNIKGFTTTRVAEHSGM